MQYRRVTVLGGSGFIGRYVVKHLAAKGAVVTVVSRNARSARFLLPMGDVGQIVLIDASIRDEPTLAAAVDGADAVISAAGILYERGPQTFDAIHEEGPAHLARLAATAGARSFVHFSALGADIASTSAYARSKAKGEAAVRAAFPGAVVLRPSIVFGPEDDFFNRFAVLARYLPALPLIGGGRTRFQPVYVGDVADALLAVLERADSAGRIYQLGGPQVYTFRELIEMMLHEIGRRRLLINLPYGLASFEAFFLEWLPRPLITRDQVKLLQSDNVVTPGLPTLNDLDIAPTALELVLPTYIDRFRRGSLQASDRTAPAGPPGR